MYNLILIVLLFATFSVAAQSNGLAKDYRGSIVVNKDPRLDVLSSKQIEINKKATRLSKSGYYPGYRIQVINTPSRDEANAVKTEMLRRFPDQKVYLLYQAPTFRVRVGNFFTQKEGATLRKMIASLYPERGIYFVNDRIEYIVPEEEEDVENK
jgi:hypothetical protein